MGKWFRAGALLLACLLASAGCSLRRRVYTRDFFDTFDTVVTVSAYSASQAEFDALFSLVQGEFTRLHHLYNAYETSPGGIGALNAANGQAAALDPDVLSLLQWATNCYETVSPQVDITLGRVTALWKEKRDAALQGDAAELPGAAALREAAAHTGMDKLVVDTAAGTARLADGALLDVGAVAKGYAAQLVYEEAKSAGYDSFLLNAGGNICAAGAPAGREAWNIGVEAPDHWGDDALADTLLLNDQCVATSGDYQRYYEIDGTRYCHIISPDTLYPPAYCRAVTVVCADAALADFLSTALFTLPPEEGEALLRKTGAQALWLLQDGSIRYYPARTP